MRFLMIASYAESLIAFRGPLIAALQQKGLEVHIAAPDLPAGHQVRAALESRGVVVHHVPLQRTGMNPLADARTLLALHRLMRRVRPACVMSYTIKPVIYGMLAGWLARVPRRFALITGLGYAFREDSGRSRLRAVVQRLYALALSRAHTTFSRIPTTRRCSAARQSCRPASVRALSMAPAWTWRASRSRPCPTTARASC